MFSNLFKEMAAKNRMTQRQLANILGISEKTMTNKIHGRTEFNLTQINTVCSLFKKTAAYLFESDQNKAS